MGSVNLDNTGSGSAITLSSDGTSLLLNGTAIGGGGGDPDLYRDNASSPTTPLAGGTNGVAIGSGSNAGGSGAIAIGNGSAAGDGAFCAINGGGNTSYGAVGNRSIAMGEAARAQGQDSVAIGENSLASSADSFAIGYNTDATATNASAFGYNAQAAGGTSVALGNSRAGGTESFAAVITDNTSSYGATGAYSIAGGYLNKASATDSLCWGGDSNLVTVGQAAVVGGWLNRAEGSYSFIGGGRNNRALAGYSRAGGHDADTNDDHGKDVWASGDFSSRGDAQTAKRVLRSDTTDATAEALTSINGSPNTTNQVVLPNNSAYFFTGTCIARQQAADGTDVGAWEFKGAIRREANAGTTTLIKSTIDEFNVPTGWALALSADTTNGCLKIEVTGAASTDIRWVATVHTSEVTYA